MAPDVPKTLQGAVSTPSSRAEAGVTVRERAEHIKKKRTKPPASNRSSGNNAGLKALALARESRSQQQQQGGECPLREAQLTQEQRDEMATCALIRQIQKEEAVAKADAALALRLSLED